jgi:hypothetical protein
MNRSTRRQFLVACAVSGVASVAGCTDLGRAPSTRLGVLWAQNYTAEPRQVSVLVRRGGAVVYWTSVELEPPDTQTGALDGVMFEGVPDDPGHYVVYVRADWSPADSWATFDTAEHDGDCLDLRIEVGDPFEDPVPPELGFSVGRGESVCDDETTATD